jgi:uncharacterized membrane protein YfcA
MPIDILLIVVSTSVIQSVFGVGVLLFGTPLLLLLGYEFVDALGVLLPVSIAISSDSNTEIATVKKTYVPRKIFVTDH